MARYFFNGRTKQFAKIIGNNAFTRRKNDEPWQDKGVINTDLFFSRADQGYWPEVSAEEAGDRPYADCSKCAENWPELFDYHPDGYLVSKVARGRGGNLIKPGDIIRGTVNAQGNLCIGINGHGYQLSRVVYEMFNGPIPDGYVIKNANKSCAKIENLKLISRIEKITKHNVIGKSGIRGVYWNKKNNKWIASVSYGYLGSFDNINDAINACIMGEIKRYGRQLNNFPDYISPDEEERIKQRYYEGEEMKQIEINTESHEHEQELPRAFKYHGHDVRVNEADELNLIDVAAAMGVNDEDDLRRRIESLNKLPGYIHCVEQCGMQIENGHAPFEIAGMVAARIGAEKDRIDLSLAFHKFKNDRICAAIARKTDGEQVDSKKVESLKAELAALKADKAKATLYDINSYYRKYIDECAERMRVEHQRDNLEGQISELQGLLNVAREDRNNYQDRAKYWNHQYNQANKAFGEEQDKRQKLERENDNLVKTNCELRQKLNAANDEDAKAKAAADKQTINDLRADLEEAKETINAQQQEARNKALAIKGYQLKVAELEDDKRELQNNLNILQTGHNILLDRYNKLTARNMRRRAAQKRYMGDLHNNHVTDALEWMQAIKGAGDYYKQRQQRNQERYRKLIMALQDKVKELLYRLDKKPEGGFFNKVKSLFHH